MREMIGMRRITRNKKKRKSQGDKDIITKDTYLASGL